MSAQLSRITVADDTVYPRTYVLPAVGVAALERGRVAFTVMVEAQDVLRVRKAIVGMGGAAVEIIKCVPVPRSTRMRLFVRLEAGCMDATIRQIMHAVECGEFGRVVRLSGEIEAYAVRPRPSPPSKLAKRVTFWSVHVSPAP